MNLGRILGINSRPTNEVTDNATVRKRLSDQLLKMISTCTSVDELIQLDKDFKSVIAHIEGGQPSTDTSATYNELTNFAKFPGRELKQIFSKASSWFASADRERSEEAAEIIEKFNQDKEKAEIDLLNLQYCKAVNHSSADMDEEKEVLDKIVNIVIESRTAKVRSGDDFKVNLNDSKLSQTSLCLISAALKIVSRYQRNIDLSLDRCNIDSEMLPNLELTDSVRGLSLNENNLTTPGCFKYSSRLSNLSLRDNKIRNPILWTHHTDIIGEVKTTNIKNQDLVILYQRVDRKIIPSIIISSDDFDIDEMEKHRQEQKVDKFHVKEIPKLQYRQNANALYNFFKKIYIA